MLYLRGTGNSSVGLWDYGHCSHVNTVVTASPDYSQITSVKVKKLCPVCHFSMPLPLLVLDASSLLMIRRSVFRFYLHLHKLLHGPRHPKSMSWRTDAEVSLILWAVILSHNPGAITDSAVALPPSQQAAAGFSAAFRLHKVCHEASLEMPIEGSKRKSSGHV